MSEQNQKRNLEQRMSNADWYYMHSDDGATGRRGKEIIDGILKDLSAMAKTNHAGAVELWNRYAPQERKTPQFLYTQAELDKQRAIELKWLKSLEPKESKDIGKSQGFGY